MGERLRELVYTDTEGSDLTDEEIADISSALPGYFREKVEASVSVEQKMQRLSSGLLLTYLLRCHGIEAAGVKISPGPHGKPGLINAGGLYFNLSHSADLSLLILADSEAGCDIQKIKGGSARLAARFFTPEENEELKKAEDADRTFTRLWARKESYIKALGEGLGHDLRSFSVLSDEMPDGFYLADYELKDYLAALCLRVEAVSGGESFPDLRFIPFQNLVNVL